MSKNKASKMRRLAAAISGIACVAVLLLSLYINKNALDNPFKKDNINHDDDYVKVLDVGQGDCILIYSNGQIALIDTGLSKTASNICSLLGELGVKEIDVLLISHLHDDHTGGIDRITDVLRVKNLILPSISIESEGLTSAELAMGRVKDNGGEIFGATAGMNFNLGDFEITVLGSYDEMRDENDRSLIVMAEIRGKKFLFTGDAENQAENRLLKDGINVDCDVLKVGHHGSGGSTSEEFLSRCSPKYAVISVGEDNIYGHPHNELLARLERANAKILRTDINGTVSFYVNENYISCKTEKK